MKKRKKDKGVAFFEKILSEALEERKRQPKQTEIEKWATILDQSDIEESDFPSLQVEDLREAGLVCSSVFLKAIVAYCNDYHFYSTAKASRQQWSQIRKSKGITVTSKDRRVKLNVGGKLFETTSTTLINREPLSFLAAMFSGSFPDQVDKEGYYFIDRDGEYFGVLLNYLRTGHIAIDHEDIQQKRSILREAAFFGFQGVIDEISRTKYIFEPAKNIRSTCRSLVPGIMHWIGTREGAYPDNCRNPEDLGEVEIMIIPSLECWECERCYQREAAKAKGDNKACKVEKLTQRHATEETLENTCLWKEGKNSFGTIFSKKDVSRQSCWDWNYVCEWKGAVFRFKNYEIQPHSVGLMIADCGGEGEPFTVNLVLEAEKNGEW
eukprot:CAMPEP_0174267264 /NCGR_PEP_ID=MMETSP0439-20130205/33022_1 /TAXON_ID=0 /ORGANISM="Stereomyxa ramosa, Strain Chinc5" /LENGTH=379 /DNA_ID=CAMNT_0015354663 /DNA_START=27 /DNA_END=1163 /DNA_ORIENTATION=+